MSAGAAVAPQRLAAAELEPAVTARLERWQRTELPRRLWRRDYRIWSAEPLPELGDRLGWLELPETMAARAAGLEQFAGEQRARGIRQVVLLGMGGSSLAPELFAAALGGAGAGFRLADSTHPDAVRALSAELDPGGTLFVVSSKSGTTVETRSLLGHFWRWCESQGVSPGERFVAITDPGTPLERLAAERGFARCETAPPEVGGRYSALTPFGLLPAALCGVDLDRLLGSARQMAERCGPEVPAADNPGLVLGALLGEASAAGRWLLRLTPPREAKLLLDWLEQLVAESTGKQGHGVLPLPASPLGAAGRDDRTIAAGYGRVAAGPGAGPAATFELAEPYQLGGEIFRWQVAVAVCGEVLGVNPFDQPDVELAKRMAGRALRGETPEAAGEPRSAGAAALREWLGGRGGADYLAIQAFLAPGREIARQLELLRCRLGELGGLAATAGFGPRFLHSTGQLHKGGPASGRFLQLVDRPASDVEIPGEDTTFGRLVRAQADGDAAALAERGRPPLRLDLGPAPAEELARLVAELAGG